MASYVDSEPTFTVGSEAISRNAIERDIFLLIGSFAKVFRLHSIQPYHVYHSRSHLDHVAIEKSAHFRHVFKHMEGL